MLVYSGYTVSTYRHYNLFPRQHDRRETAITREGCFIGKIAGPKGLHELQPIHTQIHALASLKATRDSPYLPCAPWSAVFNQYRRTVWEIHVRHRVQ